MVGTAYSTWGACTYLTRGPEKLLVQKQSLQEAQAATQAALLLNPQNVWQIGTLAEVRNKSVQKSHDGGP